MNREENKTGLQEDRKKIEDPKYLECTHWLNHISHNFPFSNYGKRVILILEFMPNVPEFLSNVSKYYAI